MTTQTVTKGLEGVIAAESAVCLIDGEAGELSYRGYDIHDLVQGSFEETVFLLWNDRLPAKRELEEFRADLARHRPLDDRLITFMKGLPAEAAPMDVLRTVVSAIPVSKGVSQIETDEASVKEAAMDLTAQFPTIVAAWERIRSGEEPIAPDPELSHAANYLYMMRGERPGPVAERAMDVALILHAEHGFNASTFSARVTSATVTDVYTAVTSAIGTLKGPLHGGANEGVIKNLLEIGDIDKVEEWVRQKLAAKEKIMGFGHRVYRTMDPRAVHLRKLSQELGEEAGTTKWYEMSVKMMEAVKEQKGLNPNVDFFSASTYYTMGIPTDLFTPTFAVSRIAGWSAHIMEQLADNRLIRPRSRYIGHKDLEYVPVEKRQ
ncbi:MAG: citrate synthase [Euryarchaeota archaeon]|nr:citrate synthase [Euryarchaeota archaeon]